MVDGGREGGHPVKCGRPHEFLNSNSKKWSKFAKTGLLQMLSVSPYLIALFGNNISTFNQLRPVIHSIFEGEGGGIKGQNVDVQIRNLGGIQISAICGRLWMGEGGGSNFRGFCVDVIYVYSLTSVS